MTVAELIYLLQSYPPDTEVRVRAKEYEYYKPIQGTGWDKRASGWVLIVVEED